MKTLIVNRAQVAKLLSMTDCMQVMQETLSMLAREQAINPLRHGLWLPGRRGVLGMMPAYLGDYDRVGLKAVSVFPGNEGTEFDVHQGAVLLNEAQNGRLLAIVDASEITAIRTAAVSGIATQQLARNDADDLAILGSGVQARTHLEAMRVARGIRRVRVWSRSAGHAKRFADEASSRLDLEVVTAETAQDAVDGASIVCTTTSASEPIVLGDWLSPGAHVNAIGACTPVARELDSSAVARAHVFVDSRESALNEAGELIAAKKEGAVTDDHIQAELGEVIVGKSAGRISPDDITLFKGLGLGAEDVAAADFVYKKALKEGIGTSVELG